MSADHLFGAFGMFWHRDNVDWSPGGGPQAWQLLGVSGGRTPTVCDFRLARGFYILFDDHGAHYVGIAQGSQGLGARLQQHHANKPTWSRFCWFSFDDVVAGTLDGWSVVDQRDAVGKADAGLVVRECEALLIEVLGTGRTLKRTSEGHRVRMQNSMNFAGASRWRQLTVEDFQPGGVGRRVDRDGFTDRWLRELAAAHDDPS